MPWWPPNDILVGCCMCCESCENCESCETCERCESCESCDRCESRESWENLWKLCELWQLWDRFQQISWWLAACAVRAVRVVRAVKAVRAVRAMRTATAVRVVRAARAVRAATPKPLQFYVFFAWGTFPVNKTNVCLIGGARNHCNLLLFCSVDAPRQAKPIVFWSEASETIVIYCVFARRTLRGKQNQLCFDRRRQKPL